MVSKHDCLQEEPELLKEWLILDLNPREFRKIWKHQVAKRLSRLKGCGTSLVVQWFDPTCSLAKKSKQTKPYIHGLLSWLSGQNPPASARDTGLIPDLRRSTCLGVVKPVCHIYWAYVLESRSCSYWACVLESRNHNYWAHELQLLKPVQLKP